MQQSLRMVQPTEMTDFVNWAQAMSRSGVRAVAERNPNLFLRRSTDPTTISVSPALAEANSCSADEWVIATLTPP